MSYQEHTQDSLTALHDALLAWDDVIGVCRPFRFRAAQNLCKLLMFHGQPLLEFFPDKDWEFIKAHSHSHGPDNIAGKGVTKNYNTKPFENRHGLLRKLYLQMTNFRNATLQVGRIFVLCAPHSNRLTCMTGLENRAQSPCQDCVQSASGRARCYRSGAGERGGHGAQG